MNCKIIFQCPTCNKKFTSHKTCKSRTPKFCSRDCYAKSLTRKPATLGQLNSLSIGWELAKKHHPTLGKHWKKTEIQKIHSSMAKIGIPLSAAHRQMLSKVKIGKPILHFVNNRDSICHKISLALIGKPQPWNRGANHPNWQGGITPVNFKIRNSLKMKKWRRQIFQRDNFTCQICHISGTKIHADHIKPFSTMPLLRFDINNGRTLCIQCHHKTDTWGGRAIKNSYASL